MIKEAKKNGAALAKCQLYDAEDDKGKPHYDWVKAHELTFDQAKMLFDYGQEVGIEVFFSVFGIKFVEWCERIGVKRYKIACGMRDKAVWRAIGFTGKQVIVSYNKPETFPYSIKATMLYCVPQYPTLLNQLNFKHQEMRLVGFSDHTIGLDAVKIALARGAQIIEKHFCLEHNPDFPDNDWAMDVTQLRELVRWDNIVKQIL